LRFSPEGRWFVQTGKSSRGENKMRLKLHKIVPIVVFFFLSYAAAQQVTLQEQLAAQYKVVKMGSDTGGYSVVDPGTLLEIKKGGILGVPYGDNNILNTKYENGTVKSPNNLLSKGIGFGMSKFGKQQTTHLMALGDKVYPQKIEVDPNKDTVSLSIVECDKCNNTDPPTYMKAKVVFQFPKGSVAKAQAGEVEDTIGQLLAISDDSQQGQGQQQQGQGQQGNDQQQQQAAQQQAPAQQAPPPQAEPQTIEIGMTPDQVTAAMGKPDKIVKLTNKQIYYYKDMKVTFVGGKVSDVQ
jgi:hypothetical protein